MDGAPVRFFLSLHYTTFVNHEWVSDASMRASGVSSFFLASLSLSLFLQAVIRSKGNTEKLRHAPRQVPIDIESRAFFFLSRLKGRGLSLSLSFSASLIIGKVIIENKWKSRIDDTRGNLHRVKPCKIRGKRIKLNRAMIEAFETVILIFQTRLEERRNYEGNAFKYVEESKKFNTNLDSVTTDALLEFPTGDRDPIERSLAVHLPAADVHFVEEEI